MRSPYYCKGYLLIRENILTKLPTTFDLLSTYLAEIVKKKKKKLATDEICRITSATTVNSAPAL